MYLIKERKTNKKLKITKQFNLNKPSITIINKQSEPKQIKIDLCGIIYNGTAEWLNGKTGLPEGININKFNP